MIIHCNNKYNDIENEMVFEWRKVFVDYYHCENMLNSLNEGAKLSTEPIYALCRHTYYL